MADGDKYQPITKEEKYLKNLFPDMYAAMAVREKASVSRLHLREKQPPLNGGFYVQPAPFGRPEGGTHRAHGLRPPVRKRKKPTYAGNAGGAADG